MEIAIWQIILITLYSGYQIWDELHLVTSAGSPLFAGFITGLIMGDMTTGLIIGAGMQLTILGVGTFGGASRIDANSGTIIATVFSIGLGMDPQQAMSTLAVPVASLLVQLDVLARFANTYFQHRIDTAIENHDYKSIERNYLLGNLPWMLSRMIPVFIVLTFGSNVISTAVDFLNTELGWLANGLTLAGAVLPAVGFAILLRYLPVKKHFPYLILGFTITALMTTVFGDISAIGTEVIGLSEGFEATFNSLPLLTIFLIGLSLAYLYYERQKTTSTVNGAQAKTTQSNKVDTTEVEGEILDDEL
ncbi:MAG TPA: PTS sugar transporter subunit IIC [Alloiococcus sp.]|nr:PTS sugar transporter subunit IIC [Alloiococcus sp.]